ncbi:MAG: cupin domain-containing protein [Opitutaceae bacterium]|nr:cupin domain-containing protein [Opitutaceae bacterium]
MPGAGGGGPETGHTHARDHLFIVVSGRAVIRLGGERKILNPNEAFLVKGGIPHSVWNSDAQTTVMVGISVEAEECPNVCPLKSHAEARVA